jgi:saccharopine dehydrogenase-like NADP-dependent oxidoreductase
MTPKRILLFGAGRVAMPVAKFFAQQKNVMLTVATEHEDQAQQLLDCFPTKDRGLFHRFRYPHDNHELPELVKQCDIVVSLLPATMHVPIAEEAVKQRRHMVTASYVSPEMRALHDRASDQGVVLLNEVGLDPGIDHMLIMKAIDHIHHNGGRVKELVSLCGGLPDPVAAENPLRYKISWSPRGVLNAANNSAKFLSNGQIQQVEGDRLLLSAQPSLRFPTLRLEALPNRDSLAYRELYDVKEVHSICRGTLRYEGKTKRYLPDVIKYPILYCLY